MPATRHPVFPSPSHEKVAFGCRGQNPSDKVSNSDSQSQVSAGTGRRTPLAGLGTVACHAGGNQVLMESATEYGASFTVLRKPEGKPASSGP